MKTFLLLIREDLRKIHENEDAHFEVIRTMDEWVKKLSQNGHYISGDGLTDEGRYITKSNVLSDGPFIEAKEAVSGFIFLAAEDMQQAIALAHTCPPVQHGNMAIEVRPLMGLTDVRELKNGERTPANW